MKSLPENFKFDTADVKFAMSRNLIFLKNHKKTRMEFFGVKHV